MPSVGIDTESIPASSIIANAKWAQLAWQQRSALCVGERVRQVKWWIRGERGGGHREQTMRVQGGKYPYPHVLRSNVTTDACAPAVNW